MNAANKEKYLNMITDIMEEPNNMSVEWSDLLNTVADILHGQDDSDKDKEINQCALGYYGGEKQKKKLFEEMAELTQAICHTDDGKDTKWHIAEEIADVRILLEQMIFLYGIHGEVNRQHRLKMERLRKRVGYDG